MLNEKTILIVGVRPGVHSLLTLFLTRTAEVQYAATVQEALRKISTHPYDLIIATAKMKGVSGTALCRTVKATPAWQHMPVVLMAEGASMSAHELEIQSGADAVVSSFLARTEIIQVAKRFLSSGLERSLPRVPVELPIEIQTGPIRTRGQAQNISRGGLYMESEHPIPLHAQLLLDIPLPEMGCSISATGEVVWEHSENASGQNGFGVEFVSIHPAEMRTLGHFIDLRRNVHTGTFSFAAA